MSRVEAALIALPEWVGTAVGSLCYILQNASRCLLAATRGFSTHARSAAAKQLPAPCCRGFSGANLPPPHEASSNGGLAIGPAKVYSLHV
jgi:hypothetical protein